MEKIGVKFDAIITGYCCTVEQIKLTAEFIRSFSDTDTLVIVDPVLGDHEALYTGFTDAHVDAMRELCSLADLITPNRTEAALLAGLSFPVPMKRFYTRSRSRTQSSPASAPATVSAIWLGLTGGSHSYRRKPSI